MPKARVLIVDDSVVARRVLSDAIARDPQLEVVGTAPHGRVALAKVEALNPDVVTLDVEMPEMDGLATLDKLRRIRPALAVVMVSALTERGAATTLDALALGARDYVTKPSAQAGGKGLPEMATELVAKLKALLRLPREPIGGPAPVSTPAPAPAPRRGAPGVLPPRREPREKRVDVLVIGVSTGGPQALARLIPGLPGDFPVPVLIVQHMPPMFTRLLAARLDGLSPLAIREAVTGERPAVGTVLLAPGDWHMSVGRSGGSPHLTLHQGPHENSCRPAVDVLFRTAAEVYGAGTLGLVLTGMGQDGLRGSQAIVEAGGSVFSQDEATSVVWGMPGFVAGAGLSEQILPLDEIAPALVRRVQMKRGGMTAPRGAGDV